MNLEPCYTVKVGGSPVDFDTLTFDQIPTTDDADWNKAELDMSKNGFRLPTEAEWEWAAKGGKNYIWPDTNRKDRLIEYAWYSNYDGGDSDLKTHEVKKKKPNWYGLYDIAGNVCEWCWDWQADIHTGDSFPQDYPGPASGSNRVFRGGSWDYNANRCTVGYRSSTGPGGGSSRIGIRLVCRP